MWWLTVNENKTTFERLLVLLIWKIEVTINQIMIKKPYLKEF